jgi:hypothetical protein
MSFQVLIVRALCVVQALEMEIKGFHSRAFSRNRAQLMAEIGCSPRCPYAKALPVARARLDDLHAIAAHEHEDIRTCPECAPRLARWGIVVDDRP